MKIPLSYWGTDCFFLTPSFLPISFINNFSIKLSIRMYEGEFDIQTNLIILRLSQFPPSHTAITRDLLVAANASFTCSDLLIILKRNWGLLEKVNRTCLRAIRVILIRLTTIPKYILRFILLKTWPVSLRSEQLLGKYIESFSSWNMSVITSQFFSVYVPSLSALLMLQVLNNCVRENVKQDINIGFFLCGSKLLWWFIS